MQCRPRVRIECASRHEHPRVAVPAVRATLRHDVDDATGSPSILGGVAGRLELQLFDGIHVQELPGQAVQGVGRVHAVDEEAILRGARTVHGDSAKLRLEIGAGQLLEDRRVVPPARQIGELILTQAEAMRALPDIEQGRGGRRVHRFRHRADEQDEVEPFDLAQQDFHALEARWPESIERRGDVVGARSQRCESEPPRASVMVSSTDPTARLRASTLALPTTAFC